MWPVLGRVGDHRGLLGWGFRGFKNIPGGCGDGVLPGPFGACAEHAMPEPRACPRRFPPLAGQGEGGWVRRRSFPGTRRPSAKAGPASGGAPGSAGAPRRRRPRTSTVSDQHDCRRFRPHRRPGQSALRRATGLAPVFVPMFLNPLDKRSVFRVGRNWGDAEPVLAIPRRRAETESFLQLANLGCAGRMRQQGCGLFLMLRAKAQGFLGGGQGSAVSERAASYGGA